VSEFMLQKGLDPTMLFDMVLNSNDPEQNLDNQCKIANLTLERGADVNVIKRLYNLPSLAFVDCLLKNKGFDSRGLLRLILSYELKLYKNIELTKNEKESKQNLIKFILKKIKDNTSDTETILNVTDRYEIEDLIEIEGNDNDSSIIDMSQWTILGKLAFYLTKQNRFEEAKKFNERIGDCNGLVVSGLYYKWLAGQEGNIKNDFFRKVKRLIVAWDQKKEFSEEEKKDIQSFIYSVRFFQDSHEFNIPQANIGLALSKSNLDTKGKTLKTKYTIASQFDSAQLSKLLKEVVKNNVWVTLGVTLHDKEAIPHVLGLFKNNNTYYYYDPNENRGEYTTTSIESIARLLCLA